MDYDARAYDPWLGRFVQPDTIVPDQNNPLNWNRYTYAIGNPILYNDPSGHCIWDGCIVEAMIVFAVIGGVYGYGVQVTTNYQLGYSGSDAWTENIAPEPIIDGVIFAPAIPLMAPEVLAGAGYGLYSAGQSISTIPIIRVASAPLTNVGTTTFAASNTLSTFLLGPSIQKTTNDIFIKGQTTNKNTSSPDFLGQSNGPSIVIPTGVSGPKPTNNGNGVQYTGGVGGGNGLSSQTTGVRIMDPTLPNASSPGYPNGYVTYMNKSGQAINPYTGRTIERSNYWWHLPRRH